MRLESAADTADANNRCDTIAPLIGYILDLLQIFIGVLVGHVGWADVQLEVRSKVFKIIVVWQF